MPPVAAFVSYRFGGTDGVAIEAAKWSRALRTLGFETRRIAGSIADPEPGDVVVAGLTIEAGEPPDPGHLRAALDGADLVVVENVLSLPLNEGAARTLAAALADHRGRILLHHHDLPWQRRHLAALEADFPPRLQGALHVTVNLRSMRELVSRGYAGVTALHNRFDLDAPLGDRMATRRALGVEDDELLVLQPTRAIERKNVPGAVRYLRELVRLMPSVPIRYWLTGPAEDGYATTLARVLAHAPVPVIQGRASSPADAYAACDVVLFPSTWEGFGNPTIESVWACRPLVVFPYPVLSEITAFGIQFFSTDAAEDLVRFLARPDERRFAFNLARARKAFSLADLPADLDRIFAAHGWSRW